MRNTTLSILLLGAALVPAHTLAQTTFDPPRVNCDRIDQCPNPFVGGWESANNFVKYFAGELRAGDGEVTADWELGIRDSGSTANLAEILDHAWVPATQFFAFAYDPVSHFAGILAESQDGPSYVEADVGSMVTGPVNTLVIRAVEFENTVSRLERMSLYFANGESLFLTALEGDTDGEYFVIQDQRFDDGFILVGDVTLEGGKEFRPSAQFKVGVTGVVPEPGTLLLLGTGLIGLAAVASRRRRKEG